MNKGLFFRRIFAIFFLFSIVFTSTGSNSFASGNITYVDSNGLNPRSSPAYTGGYTIETFTTSGTFTVPAGVSSAEVLIVAGGGGGTVYYSAGYTGGGGGGGLLHGTLTGLSGSYAVTIGSGGASANGGNSSFGSHTALGGGYATGLYQGGAASGGSGGGSCCASSYSGSAGAAATQGNSSPLTGYGNAGGAGHAIDGVGAWGGGGGGAGGAGGAASYPAGAGSGGAGRAYNISGATTTYAAGGYTGSGAGTANTGNGGGAGQNGGSGIVIVKYLSIDPNLPTITSATSTYITTTTAVLGATIESIGGSSITDRGICYGVSASSTTCTSEGSVGAGSYSLQISGLATSTSYYYYAYAVNSHGTSTTVGAYFTTEGLTNSLMFDSAQSQYLNKTFSTATDGKKWTYSFWVKRSMLYAQNNIQYVLATAGSGAQGVVGFGSANNADEISFTYGGYVRRYTSMQFRDPSAWQHVVLKVDTTATAEADRAIFYVNGVQASMITPTTISQNDTTQINQAVSTLIGNQTGQAYGRFDGYLSDINFIDGQALTPSYFGKNDSNTGNWIPKAYQGTYGANGFHLNFSSSTALGYDTAPIDSTHTATNTWTTSGGMASSTNQVIDTPLNNFATLNPIDPSGTAAIANGSLQIQTAAKGRKSTFFVSSGKWVWEIHFSSTMTGVAGIGIADASTNMDTWTGGNFVLYRADGGKQVNGSYGGAYGASYTNGDVIRVEYNADASTIEFFKQTGGSGSFVSQGTLSVTAGVYSPVAAVGATSGIIIFNFGQFPFLSTPTTGFKSLSTANLPTPTILKPNQYFDVVTYTGNGGTKTISTSFDSDFVWVKNRSAAYSNVLNDRVRGNDKTLVSDSNTAESALTGYMNFESLGSKQITFNYSGSGGPTGEWNYPGHNFVAWNWKAGGATTTNTNGAITSTVSANQTAGFSIVKYTGTGNAGTLGHGLNATPAMIIIKNTSGAADHWPVYHQNLSGPSYAVRLNLTNAQSTSGGTGWWNNATPTPTTFSIGPYSSGSAETNTSGNNYIAYAFSEVPGYSKFGSYTGNGSTDGPFVYTGFKPRYVLFKRVDAGTEHWGIWDTSRDNYNPLKSVIYSNLSNAEADVTATYGFDILSNGFKLRSNNSNHNTSGATYIYAAFAESIMIPTVPSLPTLSSPTATSTTESTAVLGGTVDTTGTTNITARGVCYGSTPAPTTNCTAGTGTTTGTFTVSITGLATSTTYYYRAYATNSAGTAYSSDSTFTTEGVYYSLMFDSGSSQYLNKTFSTPTDNKKFTISTWLKKTGIEQTLYDFELLGTGDAGSVGIAGTGAFGASLNNRVFLRTSTSNKDYWAPVFRDTSGWYHLMIVVDTAQSVQADRAKLYVNGVLQEKVSSSLSLNESISFNTAAQHYIGGYYSGYYANGYLSDYYFVDGQALTPSYFGKTDSNTGNWIPKKYTGTYGANGFYLQFNNSSSLGTDTSGNGNHWASNGGITSANNQVIDTPLNNFTTWNGLLKPTTGSPTYSAGNLKWSNTSSDTEVPVYANVPTTGKWYAEFKCTTIVAGCTFFIHDFYKESTGRPYWNYTGPGSHSNQKPAYYMNGNIYHSGGTLAATSFTANDIISIAYDADSGKVWFAKNGTWQNSGNPSAGTGQVDTLTVGDDVAMGAMGYQSTIVVANFGQRGFSYTPPIGFKALSSANLPVPTILKPNQHFDAVTYSGSNSTQSITSLNFKPDFVWIKSRSTADSHALFDAVRSVSNGSLSPNNSNAEDTTARFSSFDSSGFTLPSGGWGMTNASGQTFVAWNWKGGNATTTNTSGSITSTVSANPTAGFSVVSYTGNAVSSSTVGHGLGAEPTFMIIKSRGSQVWNVYHKVGGAVSNTILQIDSSSGLNTGSNITLSANSSTFTIGSAAQVNGNGVPFVAYVFKDIEGYSKFGKYMGNGSTDGTFVYTGFKPRYVMIKRAEAANWVVYDTSRNGYNKDPDGNATIYPGLSNAEVSNYNTIDILSNGFKMRNGSAGYNTNDSGGLFAYAAFAETTMIPTFPSLPSVSSPTATSTTETTVTLGGTVDSIGGSDLTSRGICYGTAPSPTSCTAVNGTSTGTFSVDITGLASSTTYYYRVYATNVAGTAYSTDSTFTTEGTTNSLLLDSSQTQYLSKTLTSPTNNKKYTFSTWVKRSKLASEWDILSANNAGTESIYFSSSDDTMIIRDSASGLVKRTAQVFRDPSAWLHVVLAVDTTQATAANRNRLYINGVENTAWVTNTTDATLNASNNLNSAIIHRMGSYNGSLGLADGYQAETYFIDGQQLTPSYFGQTSTTTSMWIPKSYAGTYGNNGFHLNFSNANNLGKDTSGNGNDWTLNGGISSSLNQTIDTPVNNFATLNGADKGTVTLSGGNLVSVPGTDHHGVRGSIAIPTSGKWYWEAKVASLGYGSWIGIADQTTNLTLGSGSGSTKTFQWGSWFNTYNSGVVQYGTNQGYSLGSNWSGASQPGNNDIIMVAVDMDNNSMWVGKNGVWFNSSGSANPATNSDPRWTGLATTSTLWFPFAGGYASSPAVSFNFGQKAFTYTPPTGFRSLSTSNLPTPTIVKPSEHFDTVTYTGNSSTKSISSLNFKPDLVWIKGRSYGSSNHILNDIVRGPNKTLFSNQSLAEYTDRGIESFDSNGFSLSGTEGGDANADTQTYVAWNWKGSNATTTNTAGSITSVVSANPTAGFSVINYTGTGASGAVGHGLSSTPNFIIFKQRSGGAGSGVQDWGTYHSSIGSTGAVRLNLNNANVTNSTYFNNATPTATVINLGSFQNYNELNGNFIAYAFSEVPGYSKFGGYTGNNSSDGVFVYTGFKPRWIMIKRTDSANEWAIIDTARNTYNPLITQLYANQSTQDTTWSSVDALSNGFKLRSNNGESNGAGTYIYAAFAETGMIPVVSSTSTTQSGSSNLEDVTVTPGDTIATIDYTIPSNPSFNQVVVLRSTQPVTDTPVTGVSYNPGDIIGSATVACVDSTVASSTFDYCTANSLANNTAYYFKAFTKLGTIYTEVSVDGSPSTPNVGATNIAISSYRLRNDDGSEISAGYSSAENTPIVSSFISGDKKRIRFVLSNQTSALTKKRYQLEYGTNSCTTWTALPRPEEETTEHFRMERSQFLSDNASTSHSSGVSAPNGRTFISGRIQSFSSLTHPITLRNGQYTEVEYVIRATNNVISNSPYCFRLTGAGSASGFTYSQTPQITPISIVFRRQGGGGSSVNNIINLESAVIVATTTYTGGGADGSVTSTSTSVEATSTPSTQQSTTTPTRKRGGGGSVGSLKTTNYFASTLSKPQGMVLGATSDVVCTNLKHTSVYGQTDRNTNDEVSHMQYYLKQKGYFHGNVTGLFDKATERSLIEFQRNNGIRGTGILDEKTRNIIRTSSCPLLSE